MSTEPFKVCIREAEFQEGIQGEGCRAVRVPCKNGFKIEIFGAGYGFTVRSSKECARLIELLEAVKDGLEFEEQLRKENILVSIKEAKEKGWIPEDVVVSVDGVQE